MTLTTEQVRGHFVTAPMVASPREAAYDQFDEWYEAARKDARLQVIEWLESPNRALSGSGGQYAEEARARFSLPMDKRLEAE